MPKSMNFLHLRQIDEALRPYRQLLRNEKPRRGWLREIRQAIGMTATQYGGRLGVTPSAVTSLERSETQGSITLRSLSRAADALDCEVFYVVIPRKPLRRMVAEQAQRVAKARLREVDHTMRLENQGVKRAELMAQLQDLVKHLSDTPTKELWENVE